MHFQTIGGNSRSFTLENPGTDSIVWAKDPDGNDLERKFWWNGKFFQEAPSVQNFQECLENFIQKDKCFCCWFTMNYLEKMWIKRKLDAGIQLLGYRDAHLPLDDFHWTRDVSHYENFHPLEKWGGKIQIWEPWPEFELGPYDSPFKAEIIDRPTVVQTLKTDPGTWLFHHEGKAFWRIHSYDLYYSRPDTIEQWRQIPEDSEDINWEIPPEHWAFLTNVLIEMDQIAKIIGSNHPLTENWIAADEHPIAK